MSYGLSFVYTLRTSIVKSSTQICTLFLLRNALLRTRLNLVVFHVQLMYRGTTSYDWMLTQAKKKTAARKKRRAAAQRTSNDSAPRNTEVAQKTGSGEVAVEVTPMTSNAAVASDAS